jgi:Ca-activated chloride channel family protein
MRRTFVLFALALASIAAAAVAAVLRPAKVTVRPQPQVVQSGVLRMSAQLDHQYLSEQGGGEAYLQVDLIASGDPAERHRVPVNAVLILDRSGSMQGPKMDRAKEAARALVAALGADDRLSIVEFSSSARVALESTALTEGARATALEAIERLFAGGGTNMSSAFDLAAGQLAAGHLQGRVDKVFLASDGQANEGFFERGTLLRIAAHDFATATLSTFGLGDDYDEDFMNALAARSGGRARYIASPEVLPGAFRDELSRAAAVVARNVRVRVSGAAGAGVERVLGYEVTDGWVRLPDFAAGEERRVLVKLSLPAGKGKVDLAAIELAFEDAQGEVRHAQASAQAIFTSETARLDEPAGPAAASGAKAEMAEMATKAASLRESGRRAEATAQLVSLHKVARVAAAAAPAEATMLAGVAASYERDVEQVDQPGGAASKKLKEKAFDAVRAPVAGW